MNRRELLAGGVKLMATAALGAGLALRGTLVDPLWPWWPVAVAGAIAFQSALLALWQRSETWAFVSTLSIDLAVSLEEWDQIHKAKARYDQATKDLRGLLDRDPETLKEGEHKRHALRVPPGGGHSIVTLECRDAGVGWVPTQ